MKNLLRMYLLPMVVAIVLLLLVRTFILTQYVSDGALVEWGIEPGDRVLVNRLSYSSSNPPAVGDRIVFQHPYYPGHPICFASCVALPGDTIWFNVGEQRMQVLRPSDSESHPIVIPQRGVDIDVTSYNAKILWHLLRLERAFVTYRETGELLVDGRKVKKVAFLNDYYWLETHSATYGLVPLRFMLGEPWCVSYGMKDGVIRLDRLFLMIE